MSNRQAEPNSAAPEPAQKEPEAPCPNRCHDQTSTFLALERAGGPTSECMVTLLVSCICITSKSGRTYLVWESAQLAVRMC